LCLLRFGGRFYHHLLARKLLGVSSPPSGQGLPLGSWLSQWCGTFYLDGLDHYIKRGLEIPGYLRYMDDLVVFADCREQLADARGAVADWLRRERRLALNPKYLQITPCREPTVFLGCRVGRAGISPSRKLRRRLRARLQIAARKGDEALVRTIRAYRGLLLFPGGRG
jgi:RNA-directed DNA polymerase